MKFSIKSTDILTENLCFTDYVIVTEEISNLELEIERLNNIIEVQKSKLLMIKGIINTPRALDSSLAYVMVKSHIQEVLNGSLGIDIGSDKE